MDRTPFPLRDVIRVVASITTPMAIGIALEDLAGVENALAGGVIATIGALVGAMAPQRGPLREKLSRTAAGVVLGAAGLEIGRYVAGGGWQPVLVIAAAAAVAALVSAVSANVSFGSLQFLIYIAVGSGLSGPLSLGVRVGLFIAGGLWATLLTFLEAVTDRVDPDRAVVSDVFGAISRLLAASGTGQGQTARSEVIHAHNQAYDQVVRSRSLASGRSPRLAYLAGVLNSTSQLGDGAVALYRSGEPVDHEDLRAVGALATAVRTGKDVSGQPPAPDDDGSTAARAVRNGIRLVWKTVGGKSEPQQGHIRPTQDWRARIGDLASRTVLSPDSREFAVRLVLCMGLAEIVRQNLPYQRPYWVLLTVAIVLKPDFGSVFARGVQRTVGTFVGVLIGAALLATVPHNGWMLIPMAIAAANMPWTQAANYGLYVVSLTPVIVILLDLATPGGSDVVPARLEDTLVGCGIVLIFGYLLWPQTWRSSLDFPLHHVLTALDAYLGAAFIYRAVERRPARRRTYRALTELQTQLQRQLAEPPPLSTRAAAWWPVIVELERTADGVGEAAVAVDSGADAPQPEQVGRLRQAVRQLDDLTADSGSEEALHVTNDVLVPIAREAMAARRLLRRVATVQYTAVT